MPVDRLLASLRPGGRDFEHLCQWILENAPEYRSTLRQVWLWDDWPGGRGRDIGIDLVAESHEGRLWAIQAKHYDPAYAIKKADLDSFLSASSRAEFTYRLMIATTDHLGQNARSTIAIQEKPVGLLLRSQLDALEVAWPSSLARLRPAKPKRKRPRPHQRQAIKDCVQGLASADRGQLVMACGTGKTLVGPFLAERMAARRVLVLVPSLSLLGQTLREWATAVEFDYLAVCSDDTVTKDERDAVVASTSELGVPVTTDPDRIARFLRRRGKEMRVVLATYQSSLQIAAAQAGRVPAFDLVIADEAHRCAGPQAGVFATMLDATRIKARKRLFMTATPRYFTGRVKKEAKEADWEVASMDEEEKFGSVLHRLTFAQAIDQDLLADYQVVVVGVTDRQARDLADRGAFVAPDGRKVTDARTLAREIGLLRSMAKYDLHRVVTFHSRIDAATRFASSLPMTMEWLPASRRPTGTLWADHVSGKMTAGERDARLRRLRGVGSHERGVLTNARCLTEGVDVPTLDGVAFIDPRRSQIDVVQAVGRAIRKAEGKTAGTIVIPVLVDEGTDPEEALESSEFDRIWEVVRALRDHDEDLADSLDALRREQGLRGSIGQLTNKIVLDVPVGITSAFARAFDAKVVERATARWEFWFGLLGLFVAREHTARVPYHHTERGNKLGLWVSGQRIAYRERTIGKERTERLSALPGWTWSAEVQDFDEGVNHLLAYIDQYGGSRVPLRYVADDGYRLGSWVAIQRSAYRRSRPGYTTTARVKRYGLAPERAKQLAELPGWEWEPSDAAWMRGFEALEGFVAREGHARVPGRHAEAGISLGRWLVTQRNAFKKGSLRSDRVAALEALPGWTFDALEADWETGYEALLAFVGREGHARVRQDHVEDGFRLGTWVAYERAAFRRGAMPDERREKLQRSPGWTWSPADDYWNVCFQRVEKYAGDRGHARVPDRYVEPDGFALGSWASKQRRRRRSGKLSLDRISCLESLPGWTWNARKKN